MNNTSSWQPMEIPPDLSRQDWYVGTSGYYFDDWIGIFNPPRLSAAKKRMALAQEQADQDRLQFYQKYFSFVEINRTFYAEPVINQFIDIEKRSKGSMKYTVKVHREISHTKSWDVSHGSEMMKRHITAVSPLVETGRFYSFLIQLEDHVRRSQKILDYLCEVASAAVNMNIDVHIEFRHYSWHSHYALQALKDNGIGICNTEIPPVPHAFPLKTYATSDKGYIRYSGRNLDNWYPEKKPVTARERIASRNARYDYGYTDDELRERVHGQITLSKKASSIACVYNNHYQARAVQNAIANLRLVKEQLEAE